jgi:hypothetical protein
MLTMTTIATPQCPSRPAPARKTWRPPLGLVLLILSLATAFTVDAQVRPEYELPPLSYSDTPADNAVSRLQLELDNHRWQPLATRELDLLRATLFALAVPVESQVLVFSKTSLQRRLIQPRNPRALYFSDDCYVGWVPGGLMEIAATDARLGVAFFRLTRNTAADAIQIQRDSDCLSCHAGPLTGDWPGLMIRSVFVDAQGEPITAAGGFLTTHESPLSERWGGWYVTGDHGTVRHMGNAFAENHGGRTTLNRESGANLTHLATLVPTDRYLQSDSDLVALMILEHQVEMHNRLSRANLRSRRWLHYQASLRKELGQPESSEPTGSARVVIDAEANRILEYLLFCNEAPLPESGVRGNDTFPAAFTANRIPDTRGRSLKDLDLRTRLFSFRCSYMVYSQAFNHLPDPLKQTVYLRLRDVLVADVPPARFSHLDSAERQAIRDILTDTKPDLAAAWSAATPCTPSTPSTPSAASHRTTPR